MNLALKKYMCIKKWASEITGFIQHRISYLHFNAGILHAYTIIPKDYIYILDILSLIHENGEIYFSQWRRYSSLFYSSLFYHI